MNMRDRICFYLLLLTLYGCNSEFVEKTDMNEFTFSFDTELTKAQALTEEEKAISTLFIAVYDTRNALIDCKVVSDSKSVLFTISQSRQPAKVFALANVTSNQEYRYSYGSEIIDFTDTEKLKSYFAIFNHQNKVTLSSPNGGGVKCPLPMVGSADIATSGTTNVPMRLAVARFDVFNDEPLAIKSIKFANLINSLALTTEQLTSKQTGVSGSGQMQNTFSNSTAALFTYYLVGNYGENGVSVTVNGDLTKTYSRLLSNNHYQYALASKEQLSVDPKAHTFPAGGGTMTLSVTSNVEWEIIGTNNQFTYSPKSGKGDQIITVTATPNSTNATVEEDVVFRKIGSTSLAAILSLTQPKLAILPEEGTLNFPKEGGTHVITVPKLLASRVVIEDGNKPYFVNYTIKDGGSNILLTLTISKNEATIRRGFLTITSYDSAIKTYIISQDGALEEVRPTVNFTINGRKVTDSFMINVVALRTVNPIEFTVDPAEPTDTYRLRYKSGTTGNWWRTGYIRETPSEPQDLYSGCYQQNLIVDENIGPQRSVIVELYNYSTQDPVPFYTFTITQAESKEYINIPATQFNFDKWGNEYLHPDVLRVESNYNWTIENIPAWITLENSAGGLSKDVKVKIGGNTTGSTRSATINFVANGKTVKQVTITQSTTTNATRTMRYKLNIDFEGVDGVFKSTFPHGGNLYFNEIKMYDPNRDPNEMRAQEYKQDWEYGYITNHPTCSRATANGIQDEYFLNVPNYNINSTSTIKTLLVLQNGAPFFVRDLPLTLTYPAGVEPDEIVVFQIKMSEITGAKGACKTTYSWTKEKIRNS